MSHIPHRWTEDDDPAQLSPVRIVAIASAIAVHVVALGLLIAPMSTPDAPRLPEHVIQIVPIQLPPPPPPPPPPPEDPQPVVKPPAVPQPVVRPQPVRPRPVPISTPAPIVVADPRPMDVPADPPAPPQPATTLSTAPSPPASGPSGSDTRTGVVVLVSPRPPYPPQALRSRIEGTVVLLITVGPDGVPQNVKVSRSSGDRDLDRTAQRHVQNNWRFQATGQVQTAQLPIDFKIQ